MRKGSWLLALAAVSLIAGCTAGPSYLSRTVDDWQNTQYEKEPLLTGVLSDVIPLYTLGEALGMIGDWLILNPVQFWGFDVWKKQGASFMHTNPAGIKEQWFPRWFHD